MEQAGGWGAAVGVFHFISCLGPALFAIASGTAGYLQFGTARDAFNVAGVSLLVAGVIGTQVMTWLQGRFARVNAAVASIALLSFGWQWGIWGLLPGTPLVAVAKVVCDRID
jgi:predicted PurR-regulated permease PerM